MSRKIPSKLENAAAALLILGALAACPAPPAPGSTAPEIRSFTATPEVLPAGGGDVTLSWDTANTRSVSVSPLGSLFEPTGTLTLHVEDDTTFTLTATGPGGSRTATASASIQRIRLTGTVVDSHGQPAAGVQVFVNGTAFGVTNAAGAFDAVSVKTPYSVRLHVPGTPEGHGVTWGELTTPTPTLALLEAGGVPLNQRPVQLSVTWTGGLGLPSDAGTERTTRIGLLEDTGTWFIAPFGEASTEGAETRTVYVARDAGLADLVVYQQEVSTDPANGSTTLSYPRAGIIRDLVIPDGLDAGIDAGVVQLRDDSAIDVPVELDAPGWMTSVIVQPVVRVPGRGPLWLNEDKLDLGITTIPALRLPGGESTIRATAYGSSDGVHPSGIGYLERAVPDDGGTLRVDLPVPPQLIAPKGINGILATDGAIEWSRPEGSVCIVELQEKDAELPLFVTDLTSLSADARRRAGLALTGGQTDFTATCVPGVGSIEDAAKAPSTIADAWARRPGSVSVSSAIESFEAQ